MEHLFLEGGRLIIYHFDFFLSFFFSSNKLTVELNCATFVSVLITMLTAQMLLTPSSILVFVHLQSKPIFHFEFENTNKMNTMGNYFATTVLLLTHFGRLINATIIVPTYNIVFHIFIGCKNLWCCSKKLCIVDERINDVSH